MYTREEYARFIEMHYVNRFKYKQNDISTCNIKGVGSGNDMFRLASHGIYILSIRYNHHIPIYCVVKDEARFFSQYCLILI